MLGLIFKQTGDFMDNFVYKPFFVYQCMFKHEKKKKKKMTKIFFFNLIDTKHNTAMRQSITT